jgi:hypothetical protein
MCDYRTTTYVSIQIMTSTSEHVPASRLHHHDEHSNYDQYDHLLLTTLVSAGWFIIMTRCTFSHALLVNGKARELEPQRKNGDQANP